MSQENVEIVRAANEAFLSSDIEKALDALDPEIEWHATVGGIDEGRVYRGREEVVQGFVDYFEGLTSPDPLLMRCREDG